MDDASIQDAIARLDREVPRDGAHVELDQYGGGPDEGRIVANKLGYLRLGVEFLKAAYAPPEEDARSLPVDIGYLVTEDSTIGFDWFERREPEERTPTEGGRFALLMGVSLLIALGMLLVIGLITVLRWLGAYASS